jgi:hypothetical protein
MVVVINGTTGIDTPDVVVDSIGTDTSTAVAIRTNGVERMRVDASGNLLVGGASDGAQGALTIRPAGTGNIGANQVVFNRESSTSSSVVLLFQNAGTTAGAISHTNTAATYATSSDYRLKENVAPITDAASRLLALNPVRFNFIADPDKTVDGFLAHEAQAVVPEAVTGEKDGEEMQAIDQSKLVPLLTAALQDALKTIQALEARVTALETTP